MVRMFLVTANVGSVFENLEKGLDTWMNEFTSVIRAKDPEFVAIHFQETGGKNYENGSDSVDTFFGCLVERMRELNFTRGEGFVDSRSDLEHQYTALSNVYFVHESLHPNAVSIWDFQAKCFQELESKKAIIYSGTELDQVHTKEKEKFPQNFYPDCRWSRKGFIRTRWRISGEILDFVNIHLFHDSDNVVAASSFPSEFAESRQRTLSYTINRLQNIPQEIFPLFIFGDFNFRLNTQGVVAHLTTNPDKNLDLITLGTKKFHIPDLERHFLHSYHWLKQYDFERQLLEGALGEWDLNFHPTYPFEEDDNEPEKFMRTRCPAWCDRVLFTHPTKNIVSKESPVEYNVLGSKTCMGDHKPVYLTFTLSMSGQSSSSSWEQNTSSTTPPALSPSTLSNHTPTKGLSLLPSSPPYCGYRMTLTPIEVDPYNLEVKTGRHKQGHKHPPHRCLANLFGLRKIKINLNFPSCNKKSSLSSDAVSINPPSSSQVSYENEMSGCGSSSSTPSPQHSRANTIKKSGRTAKDKRGFSRKNLFRNWRNNRKCCKENEINSGQEVGPGRGNSAGNGIEIIEPLFKSLKGSEGDNHGHISKNRIILPLIMSSHFEKEKAAAGAGLGTGDIIGVDVDIQELSINSKSKRKRGFSSIFEKLGGSNNSGSSDKNCKNLSQNGKSSVADKKGDDEDETCCSKCVIF